MEKLIEYTHESRLEFDDDCLKYIQIKTEIKEKFKKR